MGKTKIEWASDVWNPVTGCSKVSPGCHSCYALTMSRRLAAMGQAKYQGMVNGKDWTGDVRCHPEALEEPLRWTKPRRIFVASMSDLFHNQVPWAFIVRVFNVMAATPWHTYMVLTKRPGRMAYFAEHIWPKQGGRWEPIRDVLDNKWPGTAWPSNVLAGTSVESQKYAPRLEVLARVPAKVRFVSVEPMIGPVDLTAWLEDDQMAFDRFSELFSMARVKADPRPGVLSWVICGGESGPGARPMHPDWVKDLRDQCQAAGVPFFFKQWGEWAPCHIGRDPGWAETQDANKWMYERLLNPAGQYAGRPSDRRIRTHWWDAITSVDRIGKKAAGALLDGREWREFPE